MSKAVELYLLMYNLHLFQENLWDCVISTETYFQYYHKTQQECNIIALQGFTKMFKYYFSLNAV